MKEKVYNLVVNHEHQLMYEWHIHMQISSVLNLIVSTIEHPLNISLIKRRQLILALMNSTIVQICSELLVEGHGNTYVIYSYLANDPNIILIMTFHPTSHCIRENMWHDFLTFHFFFQLK